MVSLYLLALDSPTIASDSALTLSGDSTAACATSFSTEAESVDGTHPPQSGDITNFACTITETDPDPVLDENHQAPEGAESVMYVPLNHVGTDIGSVTVARAGPPTFSQQAAAMSAGEWKKLDTVNHFTSPGVGQTVDELDAICAEAKPPCLIRIYGGHQASLRVFRAWNGAAWDEAGNRMFFWGGGHSSYGGNEVYTFDFDTLTWARLTEAKPLNFDPGGGRAHPPDDNLDGIADTPPTPHVYDATEFDPDTGELVVALSIGIYPTCCKTSGYAKSWRFDPNTRTWTSHDGHDYFYASCVYVTESKEMLCLDGIHARKHPLYFIDNDGTETDCGGNLIGGTQAGRIANVFRDDRSGRYYDLRKNGIHEIAPAGCASSSRLLSAPDDDLKSKFTKFLEQSGAARGGDTKIYMWAGTEKILTFDTVTKKWDMIWNKASRGNAPNTPTERDGLYRVFDKWRYFPNEGVFAGIADGDPDNGGGWWLWKPGPNPATIDQSSVGTSVQDGSTQTTLAVFLPLDSSDADYDGTAYIEYREVGAGSWMRGADMSRIRPGFVSRSRGLEETPEGYAGMIRGREPDTDYEVRVTLTEPNASAARSEAAVQTLTATTKALPISGYTRFSTTSALKQ